MSNTIAPKGRVQWIDFCRVYVAFCVIVRHTDRYTESPAFFTDLFTYRSLIYFFFFFAAYFTHKAADGQWLDFRRTGRLLWPYLFWGFVAMLTMMPLYYWDQTSVGDWSWFHFHMVLREMGLLDWKYWSFTNVPLWFMRTLIILAFFSPILQRLPMKALLGMVLIIFAASDVLCFADVEAATKNGREGVAWLPFRLYESVLALGFYGAGLLVRRYFNAQQLTEFIRGYAWVPILGSLILLPAVYHWRFNPPIMSSALVLLGVVTTMSIGCLCEQYLPRFCALVAKAGPAAFFVYVTHYPLLKCIKFFCAGGYRADLTIVQASWAPFAILGTSLSAYYLLRRFCPGFIRIFGLN
ncbi:MAG: acyltransferase family protein [Akkermansia sp.]|nr:acyltransferase family protein [Akkermansia sp.]